MVCKKKKKLILYKCFLNILNVFNNYVFYKVRNDMFFNIFFQKVMILLLQNKEEWINHFH